MSWLRRLLHLFGRKDINYKDLVEEPEPKWEVSYDPGRDQKPEQVEVSGRIGKHVMGLRTQVSLVDDVEGMDKKIEDMKKKITRGLMILYCHDRSR